MSKAIKQKTLKLKKMETVTNIYATKLENGKTVKHPAKDLYTARQDSKFWANKYNSAVLSTSFFSKF